MTRSHLTSVFFGGVEIDANRLRRSLRIGSYTLRHDSDTHRMTLTGRGGEEILCVECARESAVKFAKDFGFRDNDNPVRNEWFISVPELMLLSDGSEGAEELRIEMFKSGLPFVVVPRQLKLGIGMRDASFIVENGWPIQKLIEMIREDAKRHADVIGLFAEC